MTWQRLDLSAPEYDRPTEAPITCGLIYRGKRHAISGPPEAAKTIVACIFGLEHMRVGNGGFALIDFEMGEHATRLLLHDLGATLDEIAAVYYVTPEGPPAEADIEAIVTAGVTLVAIDAAAGAYDASGLDDMKRKDAEIWARMWVKPLWQRGIATALLDHVVKNTDNRGKFSIGTERKLGTVDVHLGLEAVRQIHRGATGLVKITTHKDRPGHLQRPHPAELHLSSDPDTNVITWEFKAASGSTVDDGDDWRPTVLMDRVTHHLRQQTEPISRKAITDEVMGKREYLLRAIDYLILDGVANERQGSRGKLIALSDLFPVPDVFPEHLGTPEGNGRVPRPPSLQEEHLSGTPQPVPSTDDDIPF